MALFTVDMLYYCFPSFVFVQPCKTAFIYLQKLSSFAATIINHQIYKVFHYTYVQTHTLCHRSWTQAHLKVVAQDCPPVAIYDSFKQLMTLLSQLPI